MSKRLTLTITLSPQASDMLAEIASKTLRSRSHAIESMIIGEYISKHWQNQTLPSELVNKSITMKGQ